MRRISQPNSSNTARQLLNEVRGHVDAWRKLPNPTQWQVTPERTSCSTPRSPTPKHLRGSHVLAGKDGRPLTQKMVQNLVKWAARRARVPHGVHILRHTYCSHLAMRGRSARSIQELAGHQNLATTQRYMHLTPATLEATVRLLNQPIDVPAVGDIVETERSQMTN